MANTLEYLSNARTLQTRDPLRTFELASAVKGKAKDDEWVVLEQLARAALDLGRLDEASDCIARLSKRFPNSPRVRVLEGMMLEALGQVDQAFAHYNRMLKSDETNSLALRRLISLPSIKTEDRIPLLLDYLDTFYVDVDGWNLLSELYASLGLYSSALSALSHPLIITPHNPLSYLRHAETAYTAGDLPLAFKSYLLCLSLSERGEGADAGKGIVLRTWWGLKLTTRALLDSSRPSSESLIEQPERAKIEEMDLLATGWIAKMYAAQGADGATKAAAMDGFLSGGQSRSR